MIGNIDKSHDPALKSWVHCANGHKDFPIQNLPFGIFSNGDDQPRAGVAIGNHIVDLPHLVVTGLLNGDALKGAEAGNSGTLNGLFALGSQVRKELRLALSDILSDARHEEAVRPCLVKMEDATLYRPFEIGDYTDFYVGIHHAVHVGSLFRPDNPLMPNYKFVPIGYHGRASSIVVSGKNVRRPNGQTRLPDEDAPVLRPSRRLDYELELGVWISKSNPLGEPITIDEADDYIGGYCLLNDWSARDIQAWEYQPLGPFLAKSFASTISPWVITPEALAPFRIAQESRPKGDPKPLPYLTNERDQAEGAFNIDLEVAIRTQKMREDNEAAHRLGLSNSKYMYWTVAQMVTHHSCNGCNLQIGDLMGTGTLSGPDQTACGSILELSDGGKEVVTLPNGEERRFLQDGDEISLIARANSERYVSIGFGECRAILDPAIDY